MIRSMTGFGRAEKVVDNIEVTVEVKAVNHRYFEFSSRLPRNCSFLEDKLKNVTQSKVARGKVEMYVSVDFADSSEIQVEINDDFASSYITALKTLSKKYHIKNDISVSTLAANNDIITLKKAQLDEEKVTSAVLAAADEALDAFVAMRTIEGEKLKNDVNERCDLILEKVVLIEEKSPETVKTYRERIEGKIKELLDSANIDEQRILTETAIFADKIAVDEETVRLRSHISQVKNMLEGDEAIGRKLDFVVQEMNREANTIGSKAQDVEILREVVEIKAQIEKIREQVQNIE